MPNVKMPSMPSPELIRDIKQRMTDKGYGEYSEPVCKYLIGMSLLGSEKPEDRQTGKQMMERNKDVWTQEKNGATAYQIFLDMLKKEKRKNFYRQFKQAQEITQVRIDMVKIAAAQSAVEVQSALNDLARQQDLDRTVRADKCIEAVQTRLKQGGLKENEIQEGLLRVLAVRSLAKAQRGKKKSLNGTFTERQIQEEQIKLSRSRLFRDFIQASAKNPKAVEAALKGHGGALEDVFKRNLRDLEPGKLPNNENLRHFLPTVEERLESLREKVKTINKSKDAPGYGDSSLRAAAAAEAMCLQNLVNTHGKGNSLKQPIPTGSLVKNVEDLTKNKVICRELDSEKVQKELAAGHYKGMRQTLREQCENRLTAENTEELIYGTSYYSAMFESRANAANLLRAEPGKLDMNAAMKELGNYYVLCGSSGNGKEEKRFQDVPRERLVGDQVTGELFGRMPLDEKTTRELLNSMRKDPPAAFMEKMAALHKERKRNPAYEAGRKQPARHMQEPQRERNTPQKQMEDRQLQAPQFGQLAS